MCFLFGNMSYSVGLNVLLEMQAWLAFEQGQKVQETW